MERKLTERVPVVVTVWPGQVIDVDERSEEIKQPPGDDHVVVDAEQTVQYQLTESNTCRTHKIEN